MTRKRSVIRALILIVLAATSLTAAAQTKRPNVVIFFMDDLGYGDLRIDGAKDVRTPNLDRLARSGVRLTQCYAAAPLCTPTRAAFMTGRYQHRIGLEDVLAPAKNNMHLGLPSSQPSLPRALKDAGYTTGLFGKWHLGSQSEFLPNRNGFDEFFGFLGGALDYYSHRGVDGQHDLFENDKPIKVDGYLTDEITNRAVSFIERHAARPFFIDVAFNATHWPYHPPDLEAMPAHPPGSPVQVARAWAAGGTRRDYVKMLERADEGVGRILATLERLNLVNDTLVIFTSDNGGEWLSRMSPLFHRKGTLWEGGLRVPCVLRWPARLTARHTSSQAAITMDLTATILAAAQAATPASHPLDGIDLIPLLQKNSRPIERTFFWLGPERGSLHKAIRDGRWKYINDLPISAGMLFDVQADPGERNELGAQHPEILRQLKAKHATWEDAIRPRETFREGQGRPVVMIGGGVYGAAMFAPHASELSRDYDVIRVQTLNVQQADRGGQMPADYSISTEAQAVHETLVRLGVTGAVDVVGSSFGAAVALRMATLYPDRVRSLVLFEPPAFWILPPEQFANDPELREMRDLSSRMSGSTAPTDEDLHRFRCILGTCPASLPGPSDPGRRDWDRSRMAMRGLAAVAAHREAPDVIRKLEVPVLLINGTDTVGFHRRINELLSNQLTNVQVASIPGTHGASRTSPAEFLAVTRAFLSRLR